jgi:outer membrane protein OmpA-like peptidoglycan-associated protein
VQDSIDACPESPGLAELNGCPDRDGDGVEDRQDNCPDTKGLQSLMGCPDSDADGIRDSEDACPEVYGLEAFDGCPDSDNDGVEDAEDECPEVVGSITNNGCPEVDESVIEELNEIGQTIYFQTNSNKLSKNDKRILSRVYETLAAYQNYEIEVQGHTDSVGAEDLNMKLSKARAQAVADYLIFKGFSRNKISARGYGESKPAESNLTARGRSLNRRVVFKLIKN